MGYDPYDYWDLGELDQKGGVPTWFGAKADLLALIAEAHAHNIDVYADLVFNHNSGSTNGASVQTHWPNTTFYPAAWRGHDNTDTPGSITTAPDGSAEFSAPPPRLRRLFPQLTSGNPTPG